MDCKPIVLISYTHRDCDNWMKKHFIIGDRRPITVSAEAHEFDKLRGLRGYTVVWINVIPPEFVVRQAVRNNHIQVTW